MPPADHPETVQAIVVGRRALEGGDFAAARERLTGIDHPEALYVLGVAAQHQGDAGAAEAALRRALALAPGFAQAEEALGRLLIDLARWDDAAALYADVLARSPDSLTGRYGLATAQLNRGECEAAHDAFDGLLREGNDRPEIRFMRARALLELGRIDEAISDLTISLAARPTALALKALAGALWMSKRHEDFDSLLNGAATVPELAPLAAELWRQSGDTSRALDAVDALTKVGDLRLEAHVARIQAYVDLGDGPAAERAARDALAQHPDDRIVIASLISALLMQGKADDALAAVLPLRRAEPLRQHWIAYEATALRLLGDPRYDALVDLERFVRVYKLPVPDGYESIEDFNTALYAALTPLYAYRHHPLDQSLRDGSQTSRDLTGVDDPVIRAYIVALDTPIRQYMREVGAGSGHPLTARNTGEYRIAGSWSVRLHGRGWHVNHVHPEGWISSAYYVVVPDDVADEERKAGWIKFGEPPFVTTPPSPPQKWIRPEPGLVVLFPSFLWHGTEAILHESLRVTAPFDVVPA